MDTAMAGMGVWVIIVVIFIVVTICVPFFILKIRNQVVEMNKKMKVMTEYLRIMAENKDH
jgi:hypothetical protein